MRFVPRSEAELGKGYADLLLEPNVANFPETRYGYVVELKYLKRAEPAGAAQVEALVGGAVAQLKRYLAEPSLEARSPRVQYIGLALVFHGWELVGSEAVTQGAGRD